ncbi:MAG: tripartite tricarboxylate transporter permease [Ramlibacter sp.]
MRGLAKLAYVDPRLLGLGILVLCFVGAYAAANSLYFVWVASAFSLFGWFCARVGVPTIPLILGMVMGDTLESALRQTLSVSGGSLAVFVTRPISATLVIVGAAVLLWPLLQRVLSVVLPCPNPTATKEPS